MALLSGDGMAPLAATQVALLTGDQCGSINRHSTGSIKWRRNGSILVAINTAIIGLFTILGLQYQQMRHISNRSKSTCANNRGYKQA